MCPTCSAVSSPDLKTPGDRLYLLGRSFAEFAGSHFDLVAGDLVVGTATDAGCVPAPDPDAPTRYRQLHQAIRSGLVRAAHDASEGGLAVALSEMAIGGLLGVDVHLDAIASDYAIALFSESTGRVVVEVAPGDADAFLSMMAGHAVDVLGCVTTARRIVMHPVIDVDLDAARHGIHRRRRMRPPAVVLSAPGTNRDLDVAFALELAGADPRVQTIADCSRSRRVASRRGDRGRRRRFQLCRRARVGPALRTRHHDVSGRRTASALSTPADRSGHLQRLPDARAARAFFPATAYGPPWDRTPAGSSNAGGSP